MEGAEEQKGPKVRRALFLALDKSGSMSGAPIESVKQGTKIVSSLHKDKKIFEEVYMIPFESHCESIKFQTQQQFDKEIDKLHGGGGTDFAPVFREIENIIKTSVTSDVTILFMTDGQTDRNGAINGLNQLIQVAKNKGKEVRFFCLGFSAGHDAQLLGQIARSGTDLGNFVYIDDNRGAQKYEDMKNEIGQIFELVPGDHSFKVTLSNGKQVRLVKNDEGFFEAHFNLFEEELQNGLIMRNEDGVEYQVEVELVEAQNETDDVIQFINFQIFDYIDKLTQNPSKEEIEKIKKEVAEIDNKLNEIF